MRNWTSSAEDSVRDRYLAAFGRALPGLSPEELLFRMRGILSVTAVDRVQIYNQRPEASPSLAADEARR
jgi:Tetracyclin repressor-like, C-terminal domain